MLDGSLRWPRMPVLAATYLPPLLILLFSLALHQVKGVDFGAISRDPVAQEGEYPLAGAQSTLGGLVWITGATVGFIGVLLLVRMGEARLPRTRFLGALSLFTFVMGIDDVFLIHDGLGPMYLGIDERPVLLLYAVASLAIAWSFRTVIVRLDPVLLVLGLSLFVGSLAVDHFQELLEGHAYRIFYEDGFKLLGIFGWAGYLVRQTWFVVVELAGRTTTATAGPAAPGLPDRFPRPAGPASDGLEVPAERHLEHAFDQPFDQRFGRALNRLPERTGHPFGALDEGAADHPVHEQAPHRSLTPGFPQWQDRHAYAPAAESHRNGYPDTRHDGYQDAPHGGFPDARHGGYQDAPHDRYPDTRHDGYEDARHDGYADAHHGAFPDARHNGYPDVHHNGYAEADRGPGGFNRFLDDFPALSPDQVASMARHRRAPEDRRSANDGYPSA